MKSQLPPLPSGWRIDSEGYLSNPHDNAQRYCRQADGKIDRLKVAMVLDNYAEKAHARLWEGATNEALAEALRAMLATALKCDDKAWAEAITRAGTDRPCDIAVAALSLA